MQGSSPLFAWHACLCDRQRQFHCHFQRAAVEASGTNVVKAVTPILIHANLFATYNTIRVLEAGQTLGPVDQTFYNRCIAAVTTATDGSEAFGSQGLANPDHPKHHTAAGQQFSDLTTSLVDYNASLPDKHQKLDRPSVLKDVSIMLDFCAVVVSAANYSHIFLTQCYDMQVLNEASLLAATNIGNHASTNIFNFTRRWLNPQSWLTVLWWCQLQITATYF